MGDYGKDPRFVAMTLIFRDLITGSNTNGKQFICRGEFAVVIDRIPDNPPVDWEMGPRMIPGEWGAFRAHLWYSNGHGPYAFAVAKTASSAEIEAAGHFAGKFCGWPPKLVHKNAKEST